MTAFDKVIPGENDLLVSWTPPHFQPDHYIQTTTCQLLCDHRTYYLTEVIINGKEILRSIKALQPGSVCLIKHVAVYNPASIDPGIGLSAHTLYSSKS